MDAAQPNMHTFAVRSQCLQVWLQATGCTAGVGPGQVFRVTTRQGIRSHMTRHTCRLPDDIKLLLFWLRCLQLWLRVIHCTAAMGFSVCRAAPLTR
jgi:hypothetical protein